MILDRTNINKVNAHLNVLDKPISLAMEITKGKAVSRSFMNVCIKNLLKVSDTTLDIGSGENPPYLKYIKNINNIKYTKADGNKTNEPDFVIDCEREFQLDSESVNYVLLFNVLEHIYDYRLTLNEIHRILKQGGRLYLYVPYFIKIHGSPYDFHRYTHFALYKALKEAGFEDVTIYTDGGLLKQLSELFNWLSKIGIGYVIFPLYLFLCVIDWLINKFSRNKYFKNYPVGYFVICDKNKKT
jgi:SAM-dependent methyltransferase